MEFNEKEIKIKLKERNKQRWSVGPEEDAPDWANKRRECKLKHK